MRLQAPRPHPPGQSPQVNETTVADGAANVFQDGRHVCGARHARSILVLRDCRSFFGAVRPAPALARGLSVVRPAWAQSWRWKSSRKLATANEAKRNCGRATDRGEEAWSVTRETMDKNRIEGDVEQGERATNRKALVVKARWRKSGVCAGKDCVLTWGDLASCLNGRRCKPEREVSRGRSSQREKNDWRRAEGIGEDAPQSSGLDSLRCSQMRSSPIR